MTGRFSLVKVPCGVTDDSVTGVVEETVDTLEAAGTRVVVPLALSD